MMEEIIMAYTHFTFEERITLESSMNKSSLTDIANLLNLKFLNMLKSIRCY